MNGPAETRPISRRRTRRRNARGTTTVEMALILLLFLTLVLGMLDLGIGVFRYNLLAQAARQGARQAIVHGGLANRLGSWGPQSYSGRGDDSHPIAEVVRPWLTAFDPSEVGIQADWIDGGNDVDRRVRIAVSAPYRPIMTFIFGNPTFTLRGTSTMPIAH